MTRSKNWIMLINVNHRQNVFLSSLKKVFCLGKVHKLSFLACYKILSDARYVGWKMHILMKLSSILTIINLILSFICLSFEFPSTCNVIYRTFRILKQCQGYFIGVFNYIYLCLHGILKCLS